MGLRLFIVRGASTLDVGGCRENLVHVDGFVSGLNKLMDTLSFVH